jgi:peptide/nickel transport system permease protein
MNPVDRKFMGRLRGKLLLIPAVGLLLLAVGAPLLAWDQPIVCRHESRLHFPAWTEACRNLPWVGGWLHRSRPFRYPDFEARVALDAGAFAIWPPIRYRPDELVGAGLEPPSRAHWLGTDDRGRDVAARLLHGATVSVRVGLLAVLIAGATGVLIGAAGGYCGGLIDSVLSRLIEAVICLPTLFVVLAILAWLTPGPVAVICVIGFTQWPTIARLVRAEFLRIKAADYVVAARSYGLSTRAIVWRHMLPGALAPVMVTLAFGVADALLIEAGLAWLGFGTGEATASWGRMLRSAYEQLRSAPHLVYPPCAAIFVSVLAFHLAGVGLRRRWGRRTEEIRAVR